MVAAVGWLRTSPRTEDQEPSSTSTLQKTEDQRDYQRYHWQTSRQESKGTPACRSTPTGTSTSAKCYTEGTSERAPGNTLPEGSMQVRILRVVYRKGVGLVTSADESRRPRMNQELRRDVDYGMN
ncbi:hypothetical protein Bbelb_410620 [Branchiostoma belcheri]|nr:hypothetical protein Bbelb_410620 [Branchiostoma belcheri]